MIVLAYLWPLALVPLLIERHDPDLQWHARHGLVLMIAELCWSSSTSRSPASSAWRRSGSGLLIILLVFGWIGMLALHVIAIVKGVTARG